MSTSPTTDPDEALLTAARAGDRKALAELLERHQQRIFGFGAKMCGDPEDAKDVAQETLLAMVRGVKEFRGDASLSTWLYTVARSYCIKKRRRTKGAPQHHEPLDATMLTEGGAEPSKNPEQTMLSTETRLQVTAALEQLDPQAREILILRDIEGQTAPEVGEITGLSVAAVKSRLHRARLALREELSRLQNESPTPPATPNCPDVLTMLSRKLEGEISPDVCAEMEQHVEGCPHCRDLCNSLRHSLAVCKALPTPQVPAEVQAKLRAAIQTALLERD